MKRVLVAGLVLSAFVACDLVRQYAGLQEVAYVTASVLNVRRGPSTGNTVVGRLERGQEIVILDREDAWIQAKLPDGSRGWIHGDYVGSPKDVRAKFEADLKRRRGKRSTPNRQPTRRVKPADPDGFLGVSIEDLIEGLPISIHVEQLDPMDGVERWMGASGDGQVVVQFWGDASDLERATMMVSVRDIDDADFERNANAALAFIRNGMPGLERDHDWMQLRLLEISSKDTGEGSLKSRRRQVTFQFLKPLGSVRIVVEVPDSA